MLELIYQHGGRVIAAAGKPCPDHLCMYNLAHLVVRVCVRVYVLRASSCSKINNGAQMSIWGHLTNSFSLLLRVLWSFLTAPGQPSLT